MARKSRKEVIPEVQETPNDIIYTDLKPLTELSVYRAGLYARLSCESEGNRERGTIETQIQLCRRYVECQEDISVQKEYFDISETGTNFDRAGFEEMINDVKNGVINCIIVKDLSRLGRNYIEAGNYVERVFPFYGIRFIAVTDNYDSLKTNEPILLGVTNIFNEMYVQDLAKKIRSGYHAAWNEGICVAGALPYGYKKDPEDVHKIVIDTEVSENVKLIFDMMLQDKSYGEIARYLNEKGIPCPKAYKKKKLGIENPTEIWRDRSIRHIIMNMRYTGDDVHNQHFTSKIGEKVQRPNDESEWIIRPNNHEAIVSREIFEAVTRIRKDRYEKSKTKLNPGMYSAKNMNFFKGKIFCKECGSPMYCSRQNLAVRYFCGAKTYRKECKPKYVRDTIINDEVLRVIHTHINIYTDNIQMIRRLNGKKENCLQFEVFSKEVRRLQRELDKITAIKNDLYEDYVARLVDAEQYLKIKADNEEKESKLKAALEEMLVEKNKVSVNYKTDESWDALINSIRDKRMLTKQMVDALVSKVVVHKNFNIEVELVYDDMLKDLVTYAKEREARDGSK
ncbi:MAG: recombinase family protein [Lachnospiraceae bacterium]|nr:recombinase family protein [Lachnospiraceae bacterium]